MKSNPKRYQIKVQETDTGNLFIDGIASISEHFTLEEAKYVSEDTFEHCNFAEVQIFDKNKNEPIKYWNRHFPNGRWIIEDEWEIDDFSITEEGKLEYPTDITIDTDPAGGSGLHSHI